MNTQEFVVVGVRVVGKLLVSINLHYMYVCIYTKNLNYLT